MIRLFLVLFLFSSPLVAETSAPLSAEEFEEIMTGKTLTFSANGIPYGIEYYAPNRRVIWSFIDGDCMNGTWYEQNGAICFLYEAAPEEPKCWMVYYDDGRIRADFVSDQTLSTIYEMTESQPLVCEGVGT